MIENSSTSDCCTACAEAVAMTQQPGATPFNRPFVGRPLGKLVDGDVIRSFGYNEPQHILGDVTREGRELFVHWRDRASRESLSGAIALSVLRSDELPSVPGAGLMPINGELVEMVASV
jgi:hypothetical protein